MTEKLFFEDLQPEWRLSAGSFYVNSQEMRDFALKWDPLPQHIDDAAAGRGGITAPGLYMFAIKMALIGKMPTPFAVIASGGYDEVRFTAPIRAGDVVSLLIETVEARASKSKQDRGIVTLRLSLINHTGVVCMTHLDTIFVLRRSMIAS